MRILFVAKSEDNQEEKFYDKPELVYKKDKQEGKPEVNQNEDYTEALNAGDRWHQMMIVVKIQQKRLKNFSYLQ